jgi:hypothetical protein
MQATFLGGRYVHRWQPRADDGMKSGCEGEENRDSLVIEDSLDRFKVESLNYT